MDYISYLILVLQIVTMILLSYILYTVFRVYRNISTSKVESENVSADSGFQKKISEVLNTVKMIRSDINELRVLIDEISRRIRSTEHAIERISSVSKAMVPAGSARSEENARRPPMFVDLNEPAVSHWYEYLKKRRKEREKGGDS